MAPMAPEKRATMLCQHCGLVYVDTHGPVQPEIPQHDRHALVSNVVAELKSDIAALEAEVGRLKTIAIQFARAIPKPAGIVGCPTCEGTGETELGQSCNVCNGRGHLTMESI